MKTESIENTQDVIDSRDVIARIEHLESERESGLIEPENRAAFREEQSREPFITENGDEFLPDMWDDEQEAEYQSLISLAEEAEDYAPDWTYGAMLIRDSYFTEYAQELADDIGAIPKDAAWPCQYIDWERAADALKQDYTSVEFDGVTYWVR
jgi:hypothetical protein